MKTVLPCKALGFSFGLITAVDIMAPENYMLQCQEKFYVLMPWHNKFPNSGICRAYAICICTHCCYLMVVLRDLFFPPIGFLPLMPVGDDFETANFIYI